MAWFTETDSNGHVVEGPAMTRICHVSNTGKASEEQLAV